MTTAATADSGATARGDSAKSATKRKIGGRANGLLRFRILARTGLRMMVHDKLKMLGTLVGVFFAVLLSNQQAGTFLGLLNKNIMFIEKAGADVWITAPNTEALQASKQIPEVIWRQAQGVQGVAWSAPLIFGGAALAIPGGGSEAVQLIGTKLPGLHGGPWNLVKGDASVLARPDTMTFEDGVRDTLGGLNLGSVREVNGRMIQVGAFTWGLLPFGPSYAFAEYDLARQLLKIDRDRTNYILVGVEPGADPNVVRARLQAQFPEMKVMTRQEFSRSAVRYVLIRTPIGITFGTSTVFGLVVGFVIVALTMFSGVIDNIREFGTLKAIGATNWDLAKLLLAQAIAYALVGSLLGLSAVTSIANAIRSPKLGILIGPELALGTTALMILLCILASSFALLRLRKLEPAMVFR